MGPYPPSLPIPPLEGNGGIDGGEGKKKKWGEGRMPQALLLLVRTSSSSFVFLPGQFLCAYLACLYGLPRVAFQFVLQVVRLQFSLRFWLYRGAVAFSFGFRRPFRLRICRVTPPPYGFVLSLRLTYTGPFCPCDCGSACRTRLFMSIC